MISGIELDKNLRVTALIRMMFQGQFAITPCQGTTIHLFQNVHGYAEQPGGFGQAELYAFRRPESPVAIYEIL